jgi:hypothetical protein
VLQSSFCCKEEEKSTKGEGEELEYAYYILNIPVLINTRGYRFFGGVCESSKFYIQCCNSRRSMSRFYEQLLHQLAIENRMQDTVEKTVVSAIRYVSVRCKSFFFIHIYVVNLKHQIGGAVRCCRLQKFSLSKLNYCNFFVMRVEALVKRLSTF